MAPDGALILDFEKPSPLPLPLPNIVLTTHPPFPMWAGLLVEQVWVHVQDLRRPIFPLQTPEPAVFGHLGENNTR